MKRALVLLGAAAVVAAGCSASPDAVDGGGAPTPSTPAIGAPTTGPVSPPTTAAPTTFRQASTTSNIAGCEIFPPDHYMNATNVDRLPVHPSSTAWLTDQGSGGETLSIPSSNIYYGARSGVPINVVDSRETGFKRVVMSYGVSNKAWTGGYPIPADPKLEGHPSAQWDRHLLMLDVADCTAYELIQFDPDLAQLGFYTAMSGTKYPLGSSDVPPLTTNSPDTPMVGQALRVDEVRSGEVDHVLAYCSDRIGPSMLWPARSSDGATPGALPMGAWVRLKPTADLSGVRGEAKPVARALAQRGAILTDTCGHRFRLIFENDDRWNNADMQTLGTLKPSDFEVIDPTSMRADASTFSYRIR